MYSWLNRPGRYHGLNERLRGEALGGPTLTLVIVATNTPATDWGIAWFGLAAVLLGGFLGGGSNLLVAWLNKRANAEAERQRHEVEVRRAARLIYDDIETATAAGRYAVDAKEWWSQGEELTSQGWQQYRDVLAPELSKIAWQSVRIAVMAIGHLQELRDGAVGGPPHGNSHRPNHSGHSHNRKGLRPKRLSNRSNVRYRRYSGRDTLGRLRVWAGCSGTADTGQD